MAAVMDIRTWILLLERVYAIYQAGQHAGQHRIFANENCKENRIMTTALATESHHHDYNQERHPGRQYQLWSETTVWGLIIRQSASELQPKEKTFQSTETGKRLQFLNARKRGR